MANQQTRVQGATIPSVLSSSIRPIVPMQHDESFLSLLSSQRELLNHLQLERANRSFNDQITTNRAPPVPTVSAYSYGMMHDPGYVTTNYAIPDRHYTMQDRRSSMDMLLSKRFSLGLGFAFDNVNTLPSFHFDTEIDDCLALSKRGTKKTDKLEISEQSVRRAKRRLSSMSFLSPSLFEDALLKPAERRDSLIAAELPVSDNEIIETVIVDGDASDSEDDEEAVKEVNMEEVPSSKTTQTKAKEEKIDFSDLKKVKELLEALTKSMEASQKSQQDIHDWDRKMGLKRSHSKTMRLSTRSRKKLRTAMKKEINHISSKM